MRVPQCRRARRTGPVRAYLPELIGDVLAERINPGKVFDLTAVLQQNPGARRWRLLFPQEILDLVCPAL